MWDDDPLKSQWAILAKAYTIIRDHFYVRDTSLPHFVQLCVPLIGLTQAPDYLKLCGWQIFDEGQDMRLEKTESSVIHRAFAPTTIAVDQVVEFCKQQNYALPRDEEWSKHVLPDGAVFAVEQNYSGTVEEPQNWVHENVPQWPLEEFELDDMYSRIDPVHDVDIPVVCNPDDIDLGCFVGAV